MALDAKRILKEPVVLEAELVEVVLGRRAELREAVSVEIARRDAGLASHAERWIRHRPELATVGATHRADHPVGSVVGAGERVESHVGDAVAIELDDDRSHHHLHVARQVGATRPLPFELGLEVGGERRLDFTDADGRDRIGVHRTGEEQGDERERGRVTPERKQVHGVSPRCPVGVERWDLP